MTRRLGLAFVVFVSACANDYDQFSFGPGPQRDASIMEMPDVGAPQDGRDSSVQDAGTEADRALAADAETGPEADSGTPDDAARDTAADQSDALDAGLDAIGPTDGPIDGGPLDDAPGEDADAGAIQDAGLDVPDADAEIPDVSVGDEGGDADASIAQDASVEADGAEDVSIGNDADAGADAPVDTGVGCDANQKQCGDRCVGLDDPATGCAGPSCAPCVLPHATAACGQGKCVIDRCEPGFGDCDATPENGCETSIHTDVAHCGGCGRACSDTHVASKQCSAGVCVSTCELGFGNCQRPASGPDDGCERAVSTDAANCGNCGNDCRAQAPGLVCGGVVPNLCGCIDNASCRMGGSMGVCDNSGVCRCGPSLCRPGETCRAAMGPDVCSCNDGAGCTDTETCCALPAGCRNLSTDPSSCGACGHTCPTGFACAAGVCVCDADGQCNAGSAGTCSAGQCICNGTMCPLGKRCLPGGTCG